MTNKIKRLAKATIVTFIAMQLVFPTQAFAAANVKIHSLKESKKEILRTENSKLMLTQEWYGLAFEVSDSEKYQSKKLKAVNTKEYEKALEAVKFDIEIIGQYDVYFLDYRLQDYSNAMALSFMDDSCVVFGTNKYLSKTAIHRLAVHELGHQVDFQMMDEEKWAEYKKIRGIENEEYYNNGGQYENRPQEIFAEDFRLIMGGEYARKTSHMNTELENPVNNEKLVEFFNELLN